LDVLLPGLLELHFVDLEKGCSMNPSGCERRVAEGRGRRDSDLCGDHKWLVEAVHAHTSKLDQFLIRVNLTLVTMCLALLAVLVDLVFNYKGGS
jgi:hypothetical protein